MHFNLRLYLPYTCMGGIGENGLRKYIIILENIGNLIFKTLFFELTNLLSSDLYGHLKIKFGS